MNELKFKLLAHKKTIALGLFVLVLLLIGGNFISQRFSANQVAEAEVDIAFDAEGPYALLHPRKDGNALNLNLSRTSSYDSITYELAYTSKVDETVVAGNKVMDEGEGAAQSGVIDRGVVGTIDTKEKKGEYEQEILFGTCSKNVCKYDKGVENGTLTLHIKKGKKAYRMITQWHLQQPDIALGSLSSGDAHFMYKSEVSREILSNVGFSIINDLTGVPKLPNGKVVYGKVYALNVPIAKDLPAGEVSIELAENAAGAKLYRYEMGQSKWTELDTRVEEGKLSAKSDGAGIFAVLSPKK